MSAWGNFKDKAASAAGKWADSWKDQEAGTKSLGGAIINTLTGVNAAEHDGWRKEVRQNIANRQIDREPNPFKDQLTNSLKGVKPPAQEVGKSREIER